MVLQLYVSETDVARSRRHFSFTHPASATVANQQFEKNSPNSERYSLPLNMATIGMKLTSALQQVMTVTSSPSSRSFWVRGFASLTFLFVSLLFSWQPDSSAFHTRSRLFIIPNFSTVSYGKETYSETSRWLRPLQRANERPPASVIVIVRIRFWNPFSQSKPATLLFSDKLLNSISMWKA